MLTVVRFISFFAVLGAFLAATVLHSGWFLFGWGIVTLFSVSCIFREENASVVFVPGILSWTAIAALYLSQSWLSRISMDAGDPDKLSPFGLMMLGIWLLGLIATIGWENTLPEQKKGSEKTT